MTDIKHGSTWDKVMELGENDNRHRPYPDNVANDLKKDEILTILATMDFFGASPVDLAQAQFDLGIAAYRVFDWLAMGVLGRIECRPAVKVLAYSFIKSEGDVDRFIADLRETDYDIVHDWEVLEV